MKVLFLTVPDYSGAKKGIRTDQEGLPALKCIGGNLTSGGVLAMAIGTGAAR